jgi:phosphoserine phosphatase
MHVLTLIAPPATALTEARLGRIAAALGAARSDWLAPEEAADLVFATPPAQRAIDAAVGGLGVDAILQPVAGRAKLLLLADMDSTIVTTETLDELAGYAGLKDRIAAITARSMNGELDFRQALIERVGLLRGLSVRALDSTWRSTELMPGAATLVATMRAHGAVCALVSGGFSFFTSRVAARLGFDHHRANTLLDDGIALTGGRGAPILDRAAKRAALHELAAAHGLRLAQSMAVGDGANDLEMLRDAGIGVAYHARPIVAREARARVDFCDLRALLFIQGYRATDFSTDVLAAPA